MASTNRHWWAWGLVVLIILLQSAFMILEMFCWIDLAKRVADLDPSIAMPTRSIGANQGLYNGFLAAGLVWSLWGSKPPELDRRLALFFVTCVLVAGLFGAATVNPPNYHLLLLQALPALIAFMALWKLPPETADTK